MCRTQARVKARCPDPAKVFSTSCRQAAQLGVAPEKRARSVVSGHGGTSWAQRGHVKEACAPSGRVANATPGAAAPPSWAAPASSGGPWQPLAQSRPGFGRKASWGPGRPGPRGFHLLLGTCVASLHVALSSRPRRLQHRLCHRLFRSVARFGKGTITPMLFLKSHV